MGIFADKSKETGPFFVRGERQLECRVCGHTTFWRRKAQLNTAAMSLFDLDWLNKTATCVICNQCGYIHWFAEH